MIETGDELLFPTDLKARAYERMFELGEGAPYWLEHYAMYLLLNGPDWDEQARELQR